MPATRSCAAVQQYCSFDRVVQPRTLRDGSTHTVYKRYFDARELAAELGGARVLHEDRWFVVVAAG